MSSDSEGFSDSDSEEFESVGGQVIYDLPSVFESEEPVIEFRKQSVVGGGRSASSYEWTSRAGQQDKRTGDYARATTKQTFSSGDESSDSEELVPTVWVEEPVKESSKQSGVVGGGHSASSYEWTSRAGQQDKWTGDYARATAKQTFSSGDTFKERSTGRVGYKDEYKETSTFRVGNKGGYSEYEVQERLRTVTFGEGSGGNGKGYNNSLTQKK